MEKAQRIRILSYNMQVAMGTSRPHHYLTHSWKHILPHANIHSNLDRIAHVLDDYDIVALQESDAGSMRSAYTNHTEYLAHKARFHYWHNQVNRNLGRFAQHSIGVLSRFHPRNFEEHKLPGMIPGRGMLITSYGDSDKMLGVFVMHLALSRRTRMKQLAMAAELVCEYKHAIFMGDMNCEAGSAEMKMLLDRTVLQLPEEQGCTFPSWRPRKRIDHILVTPELEIHNTCVLAHRGSDHLPVAMTVGIPETLKLVH